LQTVLTDYLATKTYHRVLLISAIILVFLCGTGYSQEKIWRVGMFSFFDNLEFGGSEVKIPQTMSGVMFAPEGGLRWDSVHRISVGINLMHEFGNSEVIHNFYPTAFYELTKGPFDFIMGAFPRDRITNNYPRLFIQDSVSYYRPNIEGIFLEFRHNDSYVKAWLDWTGRMSRTVREAFIASINGRYNYKILYVEHFGHMYHYAGEMDPVVSEAYHDNLLFKTSAGVNLSGMTFFDKLEMNAGWVAGFERARADNTGWIKMNGFSTETRVEYKGIGMFNTYYNGDGLMVFYEDHGSDLYWGDPVYRAGKYNRTDFYISFFRNRQIDMELTYSLHFLEGSIYHEQMLKVKIDLNNL